MSGKHEAKASPTCGVASDRVYICTQLPVVPVSSYLAFPSLLTQCVSGLFLLHFPGGSPRRTLSVILPFEARTFLTLLPFGITVRGSPIFRGLIITFHLNKVKFYNKFIAILPSCISLFPKKSMPLRSKILPREEKFKKC